MAGWIDAYVALEAEVQATMRSLCSAHCTSCGRPCCREVFCRESLESAFLARIRRAEGGHAYGARTGWLGPRGCRLEAGRPCVCYEFICPRILRRLSGGSQLAANALSEIVTSVGRSALGSQHLLALDGRQLRRVRAARMLARIEAGFAALEACRRVLGGAGPTGADMAALARVDEDASL